MNVITTKASDWTDTDSQVNSVSTATRAAPSEGLKHYITHVAGGYSSTVSGATLILKEGTTEKMRWRVFDSLAISFDSPIQLSPGTVANLVLEASGGAGNSGDVSMSGYTL